MGFKLEILEDEKQVALATAQQLLQPLLGTEKPVCWGLATGSTPEATYREIIHQGKDIDFARLTTINLDEYAALPPDHPQSYGFYMREKLFRVLEPHGLNPNKTHLPQSDASDLAAECVRYENLVTQNPPDCWLLGLGHNGHVAFNEPGSEVNSVTRLINLAPETRLANTRFFSGGLNEVPTQALTVGIKTILKARVLLMLVTGEGKAEALSTLLKTEPAAVFPASFMKSHQDLTILVDRKAAKLIL